jgi:hypothetical protein
LPNAFRQKRSHGASHVVATSAAMAEPEVVVDTQTPQEDDTEMQNVPDITVDESMAGGSGEGDEAGLEDIEPTIVERVGFVE